jgi:hypothetical protein
MDDAQWTAQRNIGDMPKNASGWPVRGSPSIKRCYWRLQRLGGTARNALRAGRSPLQTVIDVRNANVGYALFTRGSDNLSCLGLAPCCDSNTTES